MKKQTIIIMLMLPLLWTACNRTKNESKPVEMKLHGNAYPLTLEKEKEYRFDVVSKEPPIFGQVDDPDHVYAYFLWNRDKNCEVQKFTTGLELKETFLIRNGVGPGEAVNPRIFGGDKDSIIVYDPPGYKYIRFDPGFKLLAEYRVASDKGTFMYGGFRYDPVRNLVVDGFNEAITRYKRRIRLYLIKFPRAGATKEIKIFETFRPRKGKDNKKYFFCRLIHFGNYFDHIYILDKRIYRLIKMDMEGNIVADKKIKFKSVSFSTADRKKWISGWHSSRMYPTSKYDFPEKLYAASWLIQWGDGIAVGRCEDYDPANKDPVTADYFDKDLNYLGKITMPYFKYWNHPSIGPKTANMVLYYKGGKVFFCDWRDMENNDYWLVRYGLNRGDS